MEKSIIYRLTFYKQGLLKYLGTNDFLTFLIRALRRARMPLQYSQGYNPRPLISLGFPCPVGVESKKEYLDIVLKESMKEEYLLKRINKELPKDIQFYDILKIEKQTSLIEDTYGINYELYLFSHIYNVISEGINKLRDSKELKILARRGDNIKEINLKEYIQAVEIEKIDNAICIVKLETIKIGNSIIRGEEILEIFSVKPYLLKQIREVVLNV